jgi:hypothetical protein
VVGDKCYVEELRDKLSVLKHDAASLHQYGELSSSIDFYNNLSPDDQKVLVYLVLAERNEDVRNVRVAAMFLDHQRLSRPTISPCLRCRQICWYFGHRELISPLFLPRLKDQWHSVTLPLHCLMS